MSRKYKPSENYKHDHVLILRATISPKRYYMEEEMAWEKIVTHLADATAEEFSDLFKAGNTYYFSKHKNIPSVIYKDSGSSYSGIMLMMNEAFFKDFQEQKYYCKKESLSGLSAYLVAEHYPNEIEYIKAKRWLDGRGGFIFVEGGELAELVFVKDGNFSLQLLSNTL